MRAFPHWLVALAVVLGVAGCGGKDPVMPDVTGTRLDAAKSAIKDVGFGDKVKVDGGGIFGVIEESNWEVCKQSPAAGKPLTGTPRLSVERSCDKGSGTADESPKPTESPSVTPTVSAAPELPAINTVKNNPELAALLKLADNCSNKVDRFAKKYADQTIEFDGSIQAMAPHGTNKTRFDILVGPGELRPEQGDRPNVPVQ